MSGVTRYHVTVAAVAMTAAACGAATDPVEPTGTPGSGTEVAGEHRACTPLAEFENGDVAEAPVDETALFPWDRDDPAVLEGFDSSRVISGGPPRSNGRSTGRCSTSAPPGGSTSRTS